MFAPRYFAPRFFAPRYFPPRLEAVTEAYQLWGPRGRAIAERQRKEQKRLDIIAREDMEVLEIAAIMWLAINEFYDD